MITNPHTVISFLFPNCPLHIVFTQQDSIPNSESMAIISEYEEDGDTQDVIKADVQEEDDGCDEGEEDYPPDPYFSSIPSDATCSERPHDEVLGYLLREHQLQPLDLLSTVIEFLFRETDIAEQEGVELRVSEMISAAKRRRIDDEDDEDVFGVLRKIAKIEEIVDQSEEPEPLDDEEPTIRKHYPTPYEGAGDIYDVEDCLGVGEESDIPSIQQNFTQDFNASKEPAASPTLEDKAAAEKPEISEPAVGPDNVENEGGKRHKNPLSKLTTCLPLQIHIVFVHCSGHDKEDVSILRVANTNLTMKA